MEPEVRFLFTDEEVTIPNFKGAWLSGSWAWLPRPIDLFLFCCLLLSLVLSLARARALFSLVVSFSHCDLFCFASVISTFFFISVFLHVVFALIDRNLTKSSRLSVKIFSFQCYIFSGGSGIRSLHNSWLFSACFTK